MAYRYRFALDDSLRFIKTHGSTTIRAFGVMQRNDVPGEGGWEDIATVELQIEPNEAERMKYDILQALKEYFTDHYADLQDCLDWVNATEWTAEELTIPEE